MQQSRRQLDLLITLDVFSTDIQQRHPGANDTQGLRSHRAHHRKLQQMFGAAIDVGTEARKQIEALLGTPVYLDLHVKIAKDWQRDPKQLRKLGF